MKKYLLSGLVLAVVLSVTSFSTCKKPSNNPSLSNQEIKEYAIKVVEAIKFEDYSDTSILYDEILFTPYSYVDPSVDQRLNLSIPSHRNFNLAWGIEPGSGNPLIGDFDWYRSNILYDVDYLQEAQVRVNIEQSTGNAVNNLRDIYPVSGGYHVVEFYVPASTQSGGTDWKSLKVVIKAHYSDFYNEYYLHLRAIVSGRWTI